MSHEGPGIRVLKQRPDDTLGKTDFLSLWQQKCNSSFYGSSNPNFCWKLRHVFVKHRCPQHQQSQNMAKISKSYILTPLHPRGHVMSVKCEEPIDELIVQIWLLYHHPNFKYCTLFVSRMELRTDKWTDKWTDKRTDTRSNY